MKGRKLLFLLIVSREDKRAKRTVKTTRSTVLFLCLIDKIKIKLSIITETIPYPGSSEFTIHMLSPEL